MSGALAHTTACSAPPNSSASHTLLATARDAWRLLSACAAATRGVVPMMRATKKPTENWNSTVPRPRAPSCTRRDGRQGARQ